MFKKTLPKSVNFGTLGVETKQADYNPDREVKRTYKDPITGVIVKVYREPSLGFQDLPADYLSYRK